jgi:acetyltransferase-like isoleucine patch superfamily enzyme
VNRLGSSPTAREGIRVINSGYIQIGDNVTLGSYVDLVCYKGGNITIGNNVFIGSGCIIGSDRGSVEIGHDTKIAEGVTIRASNHGMKVEQLIRLQPNTIQDIKIGADVWIGKGAMICAGGEIQNGCVIGANAVVSRKTKTEPYFIYAGVPIKQIGSREDKG